MNCMIYFRHWLAAVALVVGFASVGWANDTNAAGATVETSAAQGCGVIIGYRYETRYVWCKAGLCGRRCRLRAVCCAIPIYQGVPEGNATDTNNETGSDTRSIP